MQETVLYRPWDSGEGLIIEDGRLVAWADNAEVGSAAIPEGEDLTRLLADFRVPELLPANQFVLVPDPKIVDLEIDVDRQIGSGVIGVIRIDGTPYPWEARRASSPTFDNPNLPEGARPWAADEDPGQGWEITLPEHLRRSPDTVLAQRVALAIEAFIYASLAGELVSVPYHRRVTNVFSAARPAWRAPLPLLAPERF